MPRHSPTEDKEAGLCGRLGKAMHGTRDEAPHWEYEYEYDCSARGCPRRVCFTMKKEELKRLFTGMPLPY